MIALSLLEHSSLLLELLSDELAVCRNVSRGFSLPLLVVLIVLLVLARILLARALRAIAFKASLLLLASNVESSLSSASCVGIIATSTRATTETPTATASTTSEASAVACKASSIFLLD
jgi:hypothetical protein